MSNSGMVDYVAYSPNHSGHRTEPITKITPHYVAGNCSIETLGEIFAPRSRQASSNYGIGSDGRVGLYVDEFNRAWTSGSAWNDNRAVTIECANLADGSLTDAAWNALVELCADICRRNGISDCSYTGNTDGVLTKHQWFQDTDCPGPWLTHQFERLSREVNAKLNPPDPEPHPKQEPGKPLNDAGLKYQAHVQNLGWCDVVRDGQVAGSTGYGARMEAIRFTQIPDGWKIRVRAHIEGIGWRTYDASNGTVIGTTGEKRRMEYLKFEVLARPAGDKRNLWFRVHKQGKGWLSWTAAPFASGSDGMSKRLEAVQIKIG